MKSFKRQINNQQVGRTAFSAKDRLIGFCRPLFAQRPILNRFHDCNIRYEINAVLQHGSQQGMLKTVGNYFVNQNQTVSYNGFC